MNGAVKWSDKFLEHLLKKRETNPDIVFWLRQRNSVSSERDRLGEGYWFQGTSSYIAIGLYDRQAGDHSTRSVSFKVGLSGENIEWAIIDIVYKIEQDDNVIKFYEKCLDEIDGFRRISPVQLKRDFRNDQDVFDCLDEAFDHIKPQMDKLLGELALEETLFIPEKRFEKWLNKTLAIRDKLKNKSSMKIIDDYKNWLLPHWNKGLQNSTIVGYAENLENFLQMGEFDLQKLNKYHVGTLEKVINQLLKHSASTLIGYGSMKRFLESVLGKPDLTFKTHLNQILYGPPGTGKTYKLNAIKNKFIDEEELLVDDSLTFDLAKDNAWWKIIAAILYARGPMKVPDLNDHPMIRAKHNPDKPTKANQIIWSQLQLHTQKNSEFVNHIRRHDPLIFDKDKDSNWSVDKQVIEKELIDVKSLADEIENINNQIGKARTQERFKFVTFHQSFTYEDFIEGIKPVLAAEEEESSSQDDIAYRIEKGVFYEACQESLRLAGYNSFKGCYEDSVENKREKFSKAKPYALFIDEINRGNVSSIFGELITLIEPDKRIGQDQEIWVSLPYDKSVKFAVPPNLYIIGTMNTADRSVEALDTALRRRFAFEEIKPDPSLIESHFLLWRLWEKDWEYRWSDAKWIQHEKSLLNLIGEKKDQKAYEALEKLDWNEGFEKNIFEGVVEFNKLNLARLLKTINERIELLIDKDHTIGHSYFFSLIGSDDCEEELNSIFYNKIIPLLEEYFYGDFGKIGLVLGKGFVRDLSNKNHTVFADFDFEDKELLQDKKRFDIIDHREEENTDSFLEAVKSIYENHAAHTLVEE